MVINSANLETGKIFKPMVKHF
ncbi:hypothetical protein [Enterococcus hirae]